MNSFIFLADIGADLAATARDTAERFGLDFGHFAAQCISFLIVAGLLYKFAYRRVLGVLEERRQRIAESLANAERIKQELAQTQARTEQMMLEAGQRANQLIEEARAVAASVKEREIQKAIADAQAIVEKARQAGETERDRMMIELRREIGRLVVLTTARVTGKVLTAEDQQRLIEETTRELPA